MLTNSNAFSQSPADNWFFGTNAGLSFTGGSPTIVTGGIINSAEGVSSISDASGNLLFYTDGLTVFNRNNQAMPNGSGLLGGSSSSQSAVAIRKPGSTNLYYLFTADQDLGPDGIRYSLINMSLDGGLGDIVVAQKNLLLLAPATEKLTAVRHCNKLDNWIIAHDWGTNKFYTWLVSSTGVSSAPIISAVGAVHDESVIGCMKVSPNGSKLALAVYNQGGQHFVQVFDFNASTGQVTNPITRNLNGSAYGIEFSPNGQYLYYTSASSQASATTTINQIDLCAGTTADILASETIVGSSSDGFIRTLQLGPDKKLYFSRLGQPWVGVVASPDLPAPSCGFQTDGVSLGSGLCRAGLPNFNQSFFKQDLDFNVTSVCLTASFTAQTILDQAVCVNPITSVKWLFGEPSSGVNNTSNIAGGFHVYATPGTYPVSLILNYPCGSDTIIKNVSVQCGLQLTLPNQSICQTECTTLQATVVGGTAPYTWSWSGVSATTAGPINICPTSTTTYTATVTDALGLTANVSSTVTVNSVPNATVSVTPVSCNGLSDGGAALTIAGGPYTYHWNSFPAQTTSTLSSVPGGMYTGIITNSAGCHKTVTANVTQPLPLNYVMHVTNSACGLANGTSTMIVTGGTMPYTYLWNTSPAQVTATATGLAAEPYHVDMHDANGCLLAGDVIVDNHIAHSAYIEYLQAITCHGGSNGSLGVVVTSGNAPFTYLWSDGQTTQIAIGLSAGTYTVDVADNLNCPITYSYTIDDAPGMGIQVNVTDITCGQLNGAASLNLSGGYGPFTINWLSNPGQNVMSINNVHAGPNSVSVSDQIGCTYTTNFNIADSPSPTLQINPNQLITCNGVNNGSLSAAVSGGVAPYTYLWSNGETTATIANLGPANYSCTVTDASNCSVNSAYQLVSPAATVITPMVVPASCGQANGAISLAVSGGTSPYQYSWSSGQLIAGISNLASGSYTVTVTGADLCSKQATVNVTAAGGPSVALVNSAAVQCPGGNSGSAEVSVSGGTAPYSILWSDGGTGLVRTNLSAGNYIVTATDGLGCANQLTVSIIEPDALSATWNLTASTCNLPNGAAEIIVSGGTGTYSCVWSGGQTSTILSNQSPGSISVTVTDANSCQQTFTETIIGSGGILATISVLSPVDCNGNNTGELQVNVTGGMAPLTYLWSNGLSSSVASSLNAGTYSVIVTDANACATNASFNLTEPIALAATSNITSSTCGLANGSIALVVSGGHSPTQISWSNGQSGLNASTLASGSYTATITDAAGCSMQQIFPVTDIGGPSLNLSTSSDVSCYGLSDGNAAVIATGGVLPYTTLWSDGATSLSRTNLPAGNYSVSVSDGSGCSSQLSVLISEPSALSASWNLTASTCNLPNGAAEIIVSGGAGTYSCVWSGGQTSTILNNQLPGSIGVTVTDANLCQQTFTETIISSGGISASISTVSPIDCNGSNTGELQVNATGGMAPLTYLWSNGLSSSSVSALSAGTYSVIVTDASACTANASFNLTEPIAITATSAITSSTCGLANGSIDLLVSGGQSPTQISWSNGQVGLNASTLSSGSYTATITDAAGCSIQQIFPVTDIGGPSLNLSSSINVSCNGLSDGSAVVLATGGILPYTTLWSDGATSLSRSNLPAGNYSVSVSDGSGCSSQVTVTITEPSAITANLNYQEETCGSGNGSATLTVLGGQAPFSYVWMNGEVSNSIVSQTAGNVSVTVSDANNCSAAFVGDIPAVSATPASISISSSVTCHDSTDATIQVISNQPVQVTWADGGTSTGRTNVAPGDYTAFIVDVAGCLDTLTVTVFNPPAIVSNITTTNATCSAPDGSAEINYSGGTGSLSVQWMNGSTSSTISNIGFGPVSAVVSDINGCTINVASLIGTISPLNIDTILVTTPSCVGSSDASATAQISGNSGTVSASWSNGSNGNQANNLSAGNYTLTITDASGCMTWKDFQVVNPPSIQALVSKQDATCYGNANAHAQLSISGGTSPYSVLWPDATVSSNRTDLSAGNYSVTIEDALGCQITESITIGQADSLSANVVSQPATCGTASGSAEITPSGGTMPYFYMWSNASSSNQAIGLAPGTANVLVTDAHGCQKNFSATIGSELATSVQLVVNQQVSCFGGTDGQVEITASSPITVLWNDGNTSLSRNGLAAGSYTIITSDAGGCRDTLAATVSQPNALNATFSLVSATCLAADGSVSVNVTGGAFPYAYSWSNGVNSTLNSGLTSGPLTLQITDANSCSLQLNTAIQSVNPLGIDTILVTNASCFGMSNGAATAQISGATGNATYAWSTGANSNNIQDLTAASYSLQVSDEAGCTIIKTFEVDAPSALELNLLHEDVSCYGLSDGSITAFAIGGSMPYTYMWDNVSGSDVKSDLAAGQVSLVVTDNHNCGVEQSITISQPEPLVVIIDVQASTCGLANGILDTEVNGGTLPYQYNWSNGVSGSVLNNLLPGSFTLTVTDANGCENALTKSFSDVGPPSIELLSASNISCFGGLDGSVEVVTFGGTGELFVAWNSGESTSAISNLPVGDYTAIVTDALGCTASFSHTLEQPTAIQANFQSSDVLCFGGNNGHIVSHITGGTPSYTTEIVVLGETIPQSALNLSANVYTVTITDANACILRDTITISEPSNLVLSMTSGDVLCYGENNGWAEINVSGGIAPYQYLWTNGNTNNHVDSLQSASYIVNVTDSNQCQKSELVFIDQPDLLKIFMLGPNEICANERVNYSTYATGGFGEYQFEWMTGSNDEVISFVADASIPISVVVTDENQCQASLSNYLQVYALPVIELIPLSSTSCAGECVQVECLAVEGGTYNWTTGLGAKANGRLVSFCFEDAGSIDLSIRISDIHGCVSTASFNNYFTINPLPHASFSTSDSNVPLLDAFIHFSNTSTDAVSSLWNFDERIEGEESTQTSATYQFTEIGSYPVSLTVINEFGCADQTMRWIQVKKDFAVYLPNAFTPNVDGLNDGFIPQGIGYESKNYHFEIFDRWGKSVFSTNDPAKAWDGNHELQRKDEQITNEVFVWKLHLEDFQGQARDFAGSVTLVR